MEGKSPSALQGSSSTPERPIKAILSPFLRFASMEASGGIVLLISTAVALVWANSPWESSYHDIAHMEISITVGRFSISDHLLHWINDGLMAIFFFFVGLEIKREILVGELSRFKQAAFPFAAAVGGTIMPAMIYFLINRGTPVEQGWGVPMATDIAFALGVLALLGNRVPVSLKVFVAALAIVDDILAVLVIAVVYTSGLALGALIMGLIGVAISYVANRLGVRSAAVYAIIGVFVWLSMLRSGVHATVAGILLALTIPAKTYLSPSEFLRRSRPLLDQFREGQSDMDLLSSEEQFSLVHELEQRCAAVQPPLHRIEHALQPWVSFVIMPAFALANAGVHIFGGVTKAFTSSVAIGVLLGLFVGKPIGITLFAWISTRMRIASAPSGVSWVQVAGASWLCGIGFTMSLFIATLAFGVSESLDLSKVGILAASIAAGIGGSLVLLKQRVSSPATSPVTSST